MSVAGEICVTVSISCFHRVGSNYTFFYILLLHESVYLFFFVQSEIDMWASSWYKVVAMRSRWTASSSFNKLNCNDCCRRWCSVSVFQYKVACYSAVTEFCNFNCTRFW